MRRPVTQRSTAVDVGPFRRAATKALLLLMVTASVPTLAAGQQTLADLAGGMRVRVSAASLGSSPRVGRVVAASQDTLVVQTTDGGRQIRQALPHAQITRLDVSRGPGRGHKSQYAGIGFLVGAGIAQLIPHNSSQDSPFIDDGDVAELTDGILLGGLGAAVGAYLGRAREEWRRVPVTATQVSLSLPRSGRGVGVGASISF